MTGNAAALTVAFVLCWASVAGAQGAAGQAPVPTPVPPTEQASYVVGPQDVLIITSYDDPALTGKFTVEIDGTFTYPFVGRVRVGGMTLRDVEGLLKKALV